MKISTLPHFAPEMERVFHVRYFTRVLPTLRVVSGLLTLAILLYPLLGLTRTTTFVGAFALPQFMWCLLMFGLTWIPGFERIWQPVMVITVWIVSAMMFSTLAWEMAVYPPQVADPHAAQTIAHLSFTLQVCVFMIALASFRLTFASATAMQLGVVAAINSTFVAGAPPQVAYLITSSSRQADMQVAYNQLKSKVDGVVPELWNRNETGHKYSRYLYAVKTRQ